LVIRSRHSTSDAEKHIKEKLEEFGYELLEHSKGAPDFLMIKRDENGKIKAIRFVEVKSRGDKLTPEQELYKQVLELLIEKARSDGILNDVAYEVKYV
jgi:pimeloyl-CoA synthetase